MPKPRKSHHHGTAHSIRAQRRRENLSSRPKQPAPLLEQKRSSSAQVQESSNDSWRSWIRGLIGLGAHKETPLTVTPQESKIPEEKNIPGSYGQLAKLAVVLGASSAIPKVASETDAKVSLRFASDQMASAWLLELISSNGKYYVNDLIRDLTDNCNATLQYNATIPFRMVQEILCKATFTSTALTGKLSIGNMSSLNETEISNCVSNYVCANYESDIPPLTFALMAAVALIAVCWIYGYACLYPDDNANAIEIRPVGEVDSEVAAESLADLEAEDSKALEEKEGQAANESQVDAHESKELKRDMHSDQAEDGNVDEETGIELARLRL